MCSASAFLRLRDWELDDCTVAALCDQWPPAAECMHTDVLTVSSFNACSARDQCLSIALIFVCVRLWVCCVLAGVFAFRSQIPKPLTLTVSPNIHASPLDGRLFARVSRGSHRTERLARRSASPMPACLPLLPHDIFLLPPSSYPHNISLLHIPAQPACPIFLPSPTTFSRCKIVHPSMEPVFISCAAFLFYTVHFFICTL
jgi:hypothetical protein